ncbi:MAG: hypothetical protein HKP61_06730 [Dactylosporangium sp.]|nr:hypothetical protein [Dactylosporangium sp.]NNJ60639.1 hypothetical protein [Dactylosporangium sp.]
MIYGAPIRLLAAGGPGLGSRAGFGERRGDLGPDHVQGVADVDLHGLPGSLVIEDRER